MYNDVITVFNYHEKTGAWYTSVFKNVNLLEVGAEKATPDSGTTGGYTAEAIIRIMPNKAATTVIYEPFLIVTNDGDTFVDNRGVKLSYQEPDTDDVRQYIGPKAYARLDNPQGYFTFKAETDFFVVGNFSSENPIVDDDYDEGLYQAMNDAQDGVYMICSAAYYSLLPHFEIGGR